MRCWLDARAVEQPLQQTLLLAVGEACANSIEHAYRDMVADHVEVDMTQSDSDGFLVEIRDSGSFRPSVAQEDRGRGTDIMRRLTADFTRESTPTGTVVRFRVSSGEAFDH